jgi:hypothetical protein
MAKCMYKVVLQSTCKVVGKPQFIAMNCYEITIINCQSWVNVHVFVAEGWKWIPFLLIMQQFVDGDYIYKLLIKKFKDVKCRPRLVRTYSKAYRPPT